MVENLEKYRKVRSEREAVPDGIIRVNRTIQARNFIDHVLDEFNNKNKDSVTLSSLGQAITKAVTIAEIVKHRVAGIHQVNEISTIVIDDEYEPIEEEEKADKLIVSRKLTCLQITLSKTAPKNIDIAGYQPPIPESEVNPDAGPEDDGRRQNRHRKRKTFQKKTEGDNSNPADTQENPSAAATGEGKKDGGQRRGGGRRNRRYRPKTDKPESAAANENQQ